MLCMTELHKLRGGACAELHTCLAQACQTLRDASMCPVCSVQQSQCLCMHCKREDAAVCRQTSRFLLIWLSFLPWSLWNECQWLTIPVTGIICFLLLGIENVGIQVRDSLAHSLLLPVIVLPCASAARKRDW